MVECTKKTRKGCARPTRRRNKVAIRRSTTYMIISAESFAELEEKVNELRAVETDDDKTKPVVRVSIDLCGGLIAHRGMIGQAVYVYTTTFLPLVPKTKAATTDEAAPV